MTQDEVIGALLTIRGAKLASPEDGAAPREVRLGAREIAVAEGEAVTLRLSRARLIAAGVSRSAVLEGRADWTLVDPAPISAQQLAEIVAVFAMGPSLPPAQKRHRR